jgi:hypothetical protein
MTVQGAASIDVRQTRRRHDRRMLVVVGWRSVCLAVHWVQGIFGQRDPAQHGAHPI